MMVVLLGTGSLVAFPWGIFIAAGVIAILTGIYFRWAERFILRGARVFTAEPSGYAQLLNTVEEMSVAAGLGLFPQVFVVDEPAANAFAVGRKPENSAIVVTSGLVQMLNRDELQGVVAHEIAHIQNRDVQFMTLASAILGVADLLTLAVVMLLRGNIWIIGAGLLDESGNRSVVRDIVRWIRAEAPQLIFVIIPYVLALLVLLLASLPLFLLGQFIEKLLYFACSRKREFLADACAVQYTRYPEGLAAALEKLSNADVRPGFSNAATGPLFIIDPFRDRWRGIVDRLFTTHPPTSERISILRSMAGPNLLDYEKAYRQTIGKPLEAIL